MPELLVFCRNKDEKLLCGGYISENNVFENSLKNLRSTKYKVVMVFIIKPVKEILLPLSTSRMNVHETVKLL